MRIRKPAHLKDDLVVLFLAALVIAIVMAM
jgi:hypothetical protein